MCLSLSVKSRCDIVCVFFVSNTYGLLCFGGFCLRFPLASGEFAIGILLWCERLSFKGEKAVSYRVKGNCLKLLPLLCHP